MTSNEIEDMKAESYRLRKNLLNGLAKKPRLPPMTLKRALMISIVAIVSIIGFFILLFAIVVGTLVLGQVVSL